LNIILKLVGPKEITNISFLLTKSDEIFTFGLF
jgi:hypothetical protein